MSETHKEAYDRGEAAGKVLERLDGHDKHFNQINGSIDRMTAAMIDLTRVVTAQAAGQDTRDAAVKAAAEALASDAEGKADQVEAIRAERADALAGTTGKWAPRAVYVGIGALLLTAIGLVLTNVI